MHIPDTKTLLLITLAWAVAAYLIVPKLWAIYFRHRPFFAELDRCTQTGDGHPGDPINIALVGDEASLVRAMHAVGWFPANPITVASSVRIAADTVLRRPDDGSCSAASRTLPSSNRSPAARASATTCASGGGTTEMRAEPCGSAPQPSTEASG